MNEVVFEGERMVNATDYEARCKEIIDEFDNTIFQDLKIEKHYELDLDDIDNPKEKEDKKPKRIYTKNEILPELTPMQVSSKLNEMLRIYKPMNEIDAKTLDDTEYLTALKWYMRLMSYINKYLVFLPSKQTFCGFANITVDVYNKLLQDVNYTQVFNSIEDYIIDSNFLGSKSGIVDSKTTLTQLQARDAGHNIVQNPEAITFNNFQVLDQKRIESQYKKFSSMARIGNKK